MVEIKVMADCGNSPNKELLKELMIEIAQGKIDNLIMHLDDSIIFNYVGKNIALDKVNLINSLRSLPKVKLLELKNILTHGKVAALFGTVKLDNNQIYHFNFSLILTMGKNRLIKEIEAYIV